MSSQNANQFPGFRTSVTRIDNDNPDFPQSDAWMVRVTNPRGKMFQHKFYMGYGHNGRKPTLQEFMQSLIWDAESVQDRSEQEFAEDLGYEYESAADRRKARKTYNACQRIATKLETFLTEDEKEAFVVED